MNIETIKAYDNSWWLKHLELTTVYDTKSIKAHFDWLVEQAEKAERYEQALKEIAWSDADSSCNELAMAYEVIAEQALEK